MDIALTTYFQQIDYLPEPGPTQLPIVPPTMHHNRQNNRNRQQSNLQNAYPTQIVDLSDHYSKRPMLGQTNCQPRSHGSRNHQEWILVTLIQSQDEDDSHERPPSTIRLRKQLLGKLFTMAVEVRLSRAAHSHPGSLLTVLRMPAAGTDFFCVYMV
jgi:hypothetical protein